MPRPEFAVHMLNESGKEAVTRLAQVFSDALDEVERLVGTDGREIAIVRTKFEEASFFAKKALAIRPENSRDHF